MSAASRLIGQGLRINATSPGAVQTPMLAEIEKTTPGAAIDAIAEQVGRRSTPEEQAGPLLMLNAAGASYVNGVVLPVDGGFAAAGVFARRAEPAADRQGGR
jgi:NAD(P)-dependent dehydrogenase (short-subunit alcohol dehydrogenase family)